MGLGSVMASVRQAVAEAFPPHREEWFADARLRRVLSKWPTGMAGVIGASLALAALSWGHSTAASIVAWVGGMTGLTAIRELLRVAHDRETFHLSARRWIHLFGGAWFFTGVGMSVWWWLLAPEQEASRIAVAVVLLASFFVGAAASTAPATTMLLAYSAGAIPNLYWEHRYGYTSLALISALVCAGASLMHFDWRRDVLSQILDRRQLAELTDEVETVFDAIAQPVFVTDHGAVVRANDGFATLLRGRPDEVLGHTLDELFDGDDGRRALGQGHPSLVQVHRLDGTTFDGEVQRRPLPGGMERFVWTLGDVTERLAAERQLRVMLEMDELTGLLNRRGLHTAIERLESVAAVVAMDLDGFKAINDELGHDAGDRVLRIVAHRMRGALRPTDVCARLGGDEFVVVIPGTQTRQQVEELAARMVALCRQSIGLGEGTVHVAASVGVAIAPPGGETWDVLRSADAAMYVAKRSGGDGLHVLVDT